MMHVSQSLLLLLFAGVGARTGLDISGPKHVSMTQARSLVSTLLWAGLMAERVWIELFSRHNDDVPSLWRSFNKILAIMRF